MIKTKNNEYGGARIYNAAHEFVRYYAHNGEIISKLRGNGLLSTKKDAIVKSCGQCLAEGKEEIVEVRFFKLNGQLGYPAEAVLALGRIYIATFEDSLNLKMRNISSEFASDLKPRNWVYT
uniref:DUF5405 domain-containing protein n=1 Tax=Rhabditophanes sp. KR3021 TaxID=114890 RepID=A0AC35UHF5_9BILA